MDLADEKGKKKLYTIGFLRFISIFTSIEVHLLAGLCLEHGILFKKRC